MGGEGLNKAGRGRKGKCGRGEKRGWKGNKEKGWERKRREFEEWRGSEALGSKGVGGDVEEVGRNRMPRKSVAG